MSKNTKIHLDMAVQKIKVSWEKYLNKLSSTKDKKSRISKIVIRIWKSKDFNLNSEDQFLDFDITFMFYQNKS